MRARSERVRARLCWCRVCGMGMVWVGVGETDGG